MQGHDKPENQKAFEANSDDLKIVLGSRDGNGLVTQRGERLKGENPFQDDGTRWPQ